MCVSTLYFCKSNFLPKLVQNIVSVSRDEQQQHYLLLRKKRKIKFSTEEKKL